MNTPIKIIPLGGMGNVTKNMYVYEYQGKILIVDCGIGFPDPTMLGVDILIPDISYLQGKEDQIVGMILTHGHDDHIAGIPYILPQIKAKIPIIGSKLTLGFAKDRVKEFGISPNFHKLPEGEFQLGPFTIDSIRMTHSVPDARHFIITTEAGTIYHGTDFKFDLNPIDGVRPDFQKIALVGSRGVLAMLSDSLNSEVKSFSQSELSLVPTYQQEMSQVKGKVIFTVVSSNIHRIQHIVNIAAAHNRKIAFIGRSIERNIKTAVSLGFMKLPKGIINKRSIKKLPPKQVCVIIAGSQGQIGSSLSRAAEGQHDLVRIKPEDKIIFASEPIPGNEQNVYGAIDNLSKIGADVAYSDIVENVHASGHSSAIEQQLLMGLVKPKHVIPIGGTYHHMIEYKKNARQMGFSDHHIHLLDNGQVLALNQNKVWIDHKLDLQNIMVDGLGVGDVGNIVLRDRRQMSGDGIVVIMVPIKQQTGQVGGDIEIISRGFVYIKESQSLLKALKKEAASCLKGSEQVVTNWQSVRKKIESTIERLIFKKTERRPLILTVVIEV